MKSQIPAATVSRLPVYLRCLAELPPAHTTCSSEELAAISGANSAQVRKDLSYLGANGVRGVGYSVVDLGAQLREALGLTKIYRVAIAGAGNLGAALSNYGGFATWGFEVAAVFDIDELKVGSQVGGLAVSSLAELPVLVQDRGIEIGIIATPARAAQDAANMFTDAGVTSILNFAPAVVQVPDHVHVRRVDLSTELQILTFHLHRQMESA